MVRAESTVLLALIATVLLAPRTADAACSSTPPCVASGPSHTCALEPEDTDLKVWTDPTSGSVEVEVERCHSRVRQTLPVLASGSTLTIFGNAEDNAIWLQRAGVDLSHAGVLTVIVDGGAGNDVIVGSNHGSIQQTLRGGPGEDVLQLMDAGGTAEGGAGPDTLFGADGRDILRGGTEDDVLRGGDGDDDLFGGDGDDLIEGGEGDDQLWGEAGDDTLSEGHGVDAVNGGSGTNILVAPPPPFTLTNVPSGANLAAVLGSLSATPQRVVIQGAVTLTADVTTPPHVDLHVRGGSLDVAGHVLTVEGGFDADVGALDATAAGSLVEFTGATGPDIDIRWFAGASTSHRIKYAMRAASLSANKTVSFPAGSYGLTNGAHFSGYSGYHLEDAGIAVDNATSGGFNFDGLTFAGVDHDRTRIEWAEFSPPSSATSLGWAFLLKEADAVSIIDLTIDGNAFSRVVGIGALGPAWSRSHGSTRPANGPALPFTVTDAVVERVNLRYHGHGGLLLREGEWTVDEVVSTDNAGAGISVSASADVYLEDSHFNWNGVGLNHHGGFAAMHDRVDVLAHRCEFNHNMAGSGIKAGGGGKSLPAPCPTATCAFGVVQGSVALTESQISYNGFGLGETLSTPHRPDVDITCQHCVIEGNAGHGVAFNHTNQTSDGFAVAIIDSTISENGDYGVYVSESATLTLEQSDVLDNDTGGIAATTAGLYMDQVIVDFSTPPTQGALRLVNPQQPGAGFVRDCTFSGVSGWTVQPMSHAAPSNIDVTFENGDVGRLFGGGMGAMCARYTLQGSVACDPGTHAGRTASFDTSGLTTPVDPDCTPSHTPPSCP